MSIPDVIAAAATVVASAAAICALGTWRGQMIAERRAAVADQALTDAYEFEEFFNAHRDADWAHNGREAWQPTRSSIQALWSGNIRPAPPPHE